MREKFREKFYDGMFNHEIHEKIVPQKFAAIQKLLPLFIHYIVYTLYLHHTDYFSRLIPVSLSATYLEARTSHPESHAVHVDVIGPAAPCGSAVVVGDVFHEGRRSLGILKY